MEKEPLKKYRILITLGQEDYDIYLTLTKLQAERWENEGYDIRLSSGCLVEDFRNKYKNIVGSSVRKVIMDLKFPYFYHKEFIRKMCAEKLGRIKTSRECTQMVKDRHSHNGQLNWDTYQLENIAGALKLLYTKNYADIFLKDLLEKGADITQLQNVYRQIYREHTRFLKDIESDGIYGLFDIEMDKTINAITKLN